MKLKKLATHIPENLILEATEATGLNQTQTIILGLKELIAKKNRTDFLALKGKIAIEFDVDSSRQRKKS